MEQLLVTDKSATRSRHFGSLQCLIHNKNGNGNNNNGKKRQHQKSGCDKKSKGHTSRSHGHKVQKHISLEGDRVAGVSLHVL